MAATYTAISALLAFATAPGQTATARPYVVVGTGQTQCYDNRRRIVCPRPGRPFYGQDAQYRNNEPAYKDNGDGTVTDLKTGLVWVKARGPKTTWDDAKRGAASCRVGGCTDWRMPSIKELYSLVNFNGRSGPERSSVPYIDTRYFEFRYGDRSRGERPIDCQDWSATKYVATTMGGNPTAFGVNFADGRIKGYPVSVGPRRRKHRLYIRYVRGKPDYGKNDFHDNGNGTITDRATGLTWSKTDSKRGMNWQDALAWVQERNAERYLGHSDWRLPNAKELQSIVDYSRSPAAENAARRGPAINPVFHVSRLRDGEYPCFWTSTTHLDGPLDRQGTTAVYVAFGRALGWMRLPPRSGRLRLLDVHGAGAQRSDPKCGDPDDYPHGRGPQGDVIRIYNYVRCVRGGLPGFMRVPAGEFEMGEETLPLGACHLPLQMCGLVSAGLWLWRGLMGLRQPVAEWQGRRMPPGVIQW